MKKLFLALFYISMPVFMMAQVGEGDIAPNFTGTDTHGETHTLYDYLAEGKTVVLDFFFTTCLPCQFYTPQVNLAYEKYGCNNGEVVFLSIDNGDTDAQVQAYEEEYDIEYPAISGVDGGGNAIVSQYQVFGFPTFFVVAPDSTIVRDIDPPTLAVFDLHFEQLGLAPMSCTSGLFGPSAATEQMTVFPNPLQGDKLLVQFDEAISGMAEVELVDIRGRVCHQSTMSLQQTMQIDLPTAHLAKGMYFLRVIPHDSAKLYSAKVIR